jgi:hypothetical protein
MTLYNLEYFEAFTSKMETKTHTRHVHNKSMTLYNLEYFEAFTSKMESRVA